MSNFSIDQALANLCTIGLLEKALTAGAVTGTETTGRTDAGMAPLKLESVDGGPRDGARPDKRKKKKRDGVKDAVVLEKARVSGVDASLLQRVLLRGYREAGATEPTVAYEGGLARVNSFITGGRARQVDDVDLWALHLASAGELIKSLDAVGVHQAAADQALLAALPAPEVYAMQEFEKGFRDVGKLIKRVITNHLGKKQTVYVKNGEEPTAAPKGKKAEEPAGKGKPADHSPEQLAHHVGNTDTKALLKFVAHPDKPAHLKAHASRELRDRGVDVTGHLKHLGVHTEDSSDHVGLDLPPAEGADGKGPNPGQKPGNTASAGDSAGSKGPGNQDATQGKEKAKTAGAKDQPAGTPEEQAKASDEAAKKAWLDHGGDQNYPEHVKAGVKTKEAALKTIINTVVEGDSNSALLYGMGGAGKTFTVMQQLKAAGKKEIDLGDPSTWDGDFIKITGNVSPRGIYDTLFKFKDKIILFDDCDAALTDKTALSIFKGALDTSDVRRISWVGADTKSDRENRASAKNAASSDGDGDEEGDGDAGSGFDTAQYKKLRDKIKAGGKLSKDESKSYFDQRKALLKQKTSGEKGKAAAPAKAADTGGKAPSAYEFTGRAIFISNLPGDSKDLQPIRSRGPKMDATMSKEETLHKIGTILPHASLKDKTATFKDKQDVYQFMKDNLHNIPEVTMRSLNEFHALKKQAVKQGLDWKKFLGDFLQGQADLKKAMDDLMPDGSGLSARGPYGQGEELEKGFRLFEPYLAVIERALEQGRTTSVQPAATAHQVPTPSATDQALADLTGEGLEKGKDRDYSKEKEYNSSPERLAYRRELGRINYKNHKEGKSEIGDGKDVSHRSDGSTELEDEGKNRARHGKKPVS